MSIETPKEITRRAYRVRSLGYTHHFDAESGIHLRRNRVANKSIRLDHIEADHPRFQRQKYAKRQSLGIVD